MKHLKLIVLMCLVALVTLTAVACGGTETTTTAATTPAGSVETTPTGTETTPADTTTANTPVVTTPATTTPTTTAPVPTKFEELKIGETPIADYTIVYAKSPYEAYTKIPSMKEYFPVYDFDHETATRLSDLIYEVSGVRLSVVQDTKATATDYEILVGETNRNVGTSVINALGDDDYVFSVEETKLLICGGAHGTTWHALDYLEVFFAEKLANREAKYSFASDYSYKGEYHLTVIGCIGDSITQGVGASDQAMLSYPAQMNRILWKDAIVMNFGDSGSTMREDHNDAYTKTSAYLNALKSASKVDIFTIMLGTNDSDRFRTWTDNDTAKYNEGCLKIMEAIQKKNPDIKFVLANCPAYFGGGYFGSAKMRQVQDALFEIVNQAGYPTTFYDTYTDTKGFSAYFTDTLHPNDMGHLKMAEAFAKYLQTLITPEQTEG